LENYVKPLIKKHLKRIFVVASKICLFYEEVWYECEDWDASDCCFLFLIASMFGSFVLLFLCLPPKAPVNLLLIVGVLFFALVCYFCTKLALGLWNLKRKAHQFVLAWHLFLLIGSLSSIYWNNMSWQDQVVPLILNGTIALYLFACNSFWANEQYEKGLSYES
jgi:hypothetical protein